MRKWVALFVAALMTSGVAAAQIDQMPDGVGIYFDPGATINCTTTSAPFAPVAGYLIATNITTDAGISGWEASVQIVGNLVAPAWVVAGGGTNFLTAPNFAVGVGTVAPLPYSPAIVLATVNAFVMAPADMITFFVRPIPTPSIPGHPVYAAGNNEFDLRPLGQSTGGADFPVAAINGDCPVPNESSTWGELKALFR
jgi:hypothetical protein